MISLDKRSLSALVVGLGLAFASNAALGQKYSDLPDDPGQALLADAPGHALLPPALPPNDPQQTTPPAPSQSTSPSAPAAVDTTTGVPQREATWHSLPGDFLHDQKDLWTFPLRLAKGQHLLPTLVVVGGTVGLIFADPHDMPYFRTHQRNWDDLNDVFDPLITTSEVVSLPAGLMTAGYIRHDDREVNTALLATEAYGDSVIINLAMKAITRRQRPSDVPPHGDYSDTFFNGGKSPFKGSSFPSGHATAVWSVATVVAERYRNRGKPWIPFLSYTLATAISFSRITEAAHFPSDVWLGASLGYTIAKYQTLSPR
ncbi:MAG TPA: phosphatase PAP2 family protein [Silvibacterium sp.]|nr:phosphatase PAP2 family protein [Silvibacterium sp.]